MSFAEFTMASLSEKAIRYDDLLLNTPVPDALCWHLDKIQNRKYSAISYRIKARLCFN